MVKSRKFIIIGLLTVVESPRVPFRHAPGLSFNTQHLPPDQLAVFTDGDGMSVITSFNGDPASLGYLGFQGSPPTLVNRNDDPYIASNIILSITSICTRDKTKRYNSATLGE